MSRPDETRVESSLVEIAEGCLAVPERRPVIILIGDAALRAAALGGGLAATPAVLSQLGSDKALSSS